MSSVTGIAAPEVGQSRHRVVREPTRGALIARTASDVEVAEGRAERSVADRTRHG